MEAPKDVPPPEHGNRAVSGKWVFAAESGLKGQGIRGGVTFSPADRVLIGDGRDADKKPRGRWRQGWREGLEGPKPQDPRSPKAGALIGDGRGRRQEAP